MNGIYDAAVIGAGAAGLFCAGVAARRGLRVLVLDHAPEPGRKILISGGGRCNFTNMKVGAENFLSANPHFCKSALAGFTPRDFIALVERYGIAYHEKTLGQLFCDGSARQILDMLLDLSAGASLRLGMAVREISHDGAFVLETSAGRVSARNLVIATGGLSIPKLGASGFAYEAAKRFGHAVVPPRPALVPLTFGAQDVGWMETLAGVSAPVRIGAGKARFEESLLFTHRGLSGPAVLQISSYLAPGEGFTVDFCPGLRAAEALLEAKARRAKAALKTVLAEHLPVRLAAHFAGAEARNMADLPDKALRALGEKLNRCVFTPTGNEGFAKAEVTAGGVDTAALASKSCESRAVPGLFFIGEAVDVTGWLGGYNFQWAWASGHAAGQALQVR
ncbi:NAD(P)/FAD-dependent oxidoreductase [Acidocella sp. KAb 2-4]|uniref:NAD(P)/FAD-dependent oxidoreductase n=1 Tax=Acidocella sp. KAb 2-4 TaxID=2885158 RepID=UPI001D07C8F4|nr:NAD(P)/FAD-dependent oxidoreductase [Acidocella sp. KAb 2-4]MCB5944763.1 NAD(P)/FAD-dependent oxidoreductase [Acidocella sp. KAb 2-4]